MGPKMEIGRKALKTKKMTRNKIIIAFILLLLIGLIILIYDYAFTGSKKDMVEKTYSYEVRYDIDRFTGEVGIFIDKVDEKKKAVEYYTITGTSIAFYIRDHFNILNSHDLENFSSIKYEYLEGLSNNGKFFAGKLYNSETKQQIGHWTFNLDKKEFSEFIFNPLP